MASHAGGGGFASVAAAERDGGCQGWGGEGSAHECGCGEIQGMSGEGGWLNED